VTLDEQTLPRRTGRRPGAPPRRKPAAAKARAVKEKRKVKRARR
jgi:hypothetical protein